MPSTGVLALCADDPECLALGEARPVVVTYGMNPASDWRILDAHDDSGVQEFAVERALRHRSTSA